MTATGSQIGAYRVVAKVGEGGMGEVYRAHDTKLGRDVAIKILPAAVALDPDRRGRFEREARLLAALHHPNIATIFGVEDAGGTLAIVMELVEGPTLAERIAKGTGQRAEGRGLPVAEALAIARQLAEALDAAHEKGIVHRDLKPLNIKLTKDGDVKVLDFGLATAVASAAGDQSAIATQLVSQPGSIVGTAAYMSPEQARGQAVDKRTDIWAFGCVLYEMLTGRPAFAGDTASDVLAKILEREPAWDALPAGTPAPLKRLMARCLEKDRKRRLRDIGDAGVEIEAASDSSVTAMPAPARRSPALTVGLSLLLAAAAASAAYLAARRAPSGGGLSATKVEAVTNDSGNTGQPALSPDGRLLAFASDRTGRGDMDIWVQQTNGGLPIRLTDDEGDDTDPDFSPDGSQIAFRSERNGGGVYVMPALGGAPRLVAPGGRDPRFSPDGARIAYWTGPPRGESAARLSQTHVVSLAGGSPIRLMKDFEVANTPVWSPGGDGLLVMGLRERDARESMSTGFDWWWAPIDGSAPARTGIAGWQDLWRDVTGGSRRVWVGPWTASGFLIARGASLAMLPLTATGRLTGEPRRLTNGVGAYASPTMSRDGQIVFSSFALVRTIERLPLGPTSVEPVQLFADSSNDTMRASTTRDASMTVLERVAGGRREIWSKNLATGEQRLILPVQSDGQVNATVSADGSRITYVIPEPGRPDFGKGFVADLSGGVPRPVCDGCSLWGLMPDSRRAIISDLTSIRVAGDDGVARTVVTSPNGRVDRPSVSPDGHAIAFRISNGASYRTFVTRFPASGVAPQDGWRPIDEPTTTGRPCGWSPDSSTLYLMLDADGYRDLWGQKVGADGRPAGKPYVVRHLHHTAGVSTSFGNAITTQGFVYEAARINANIWRMSPERDAR